ncbi:iron complex outermembrane recepter protein [Lutibacter oricola]|uniref:Iron complex outermembrane recepter protein n=1 Tax=Lutibacter oricola TaxID=762486 RepID=A0A1H3C4G0_9FLAO|nr:TonB-dependent receptor [Lutibacter oricola]SDX49057.1 iron complex outermembrane recepter protein [Lutibacter oricola]
MRKVLLTISVLFFAAFSYAQTTEITGEIINKINQKPVGYATIKILKRGTYTVSDDEGKFAITGKGNVEVEVSHIGYKTQLVKLQQNIIIKMEPAQIELNEILVKSNPLEDISQSVVITDATKRISQPRSVGHLFKEVQGFGIVKRGAYASEPVFRSFKYEQLNVQYDGGFKILNACPNRMDPITTHVIPEEIEKIEIVKGPFTVRFGQNFGGIVNLVAKNPAKTKKGLHGSVEGGYESNGGNLVTGASVQYVEDKYDLHFNGSYREFGDYEDGDGNEVPSSFRTTDYSVKLGYNPTVSQRLQLTWRQSFGRDIDHAGLPMDSPFDDSYLAGLDYKWENISEKIDNFSAKVFYSYVDHLMTNGGRPNFGMLDAQSPVEVATYGGKAEIVFTPSKNSRIFAGVDANVIERDGSRTRIVKMMNGMMLPMPMTKVDKIWQDSELDDYGVFVEGKFKLNKKLTLTSGVRADIISAVINDPEADFLALYGGNIANASEVNISGNVALKYQKNGLQAQIALGRGVRTASMAERFINHFSVGVDPYEYVGNPNLDPEINNQIELSFSKRFSTIEIGATVFYSLLEDYIVPVVNNSIPRKFMTTTPPTVSKQFINIDEASQTGIEFNFNYQASDKLLFTSEVSYTQGENTDLNEPLAQIPPFMANLGAKFENKNYWLALNARLVASQGRVSTSFMESETPGFGIVDFRAGFEPFKNVSIGAAVLNVLDKTYYEHLNYSFKNSSLLSGKIYEPGRNFTTYIKYNF